jgi:hypothetical protein
MNHLILVTIISCAQAYDVVNRVSNTLGLNYHQKLQVISEIKKVIPSCPFTVKEDEPSKK